MHVTMVKKKLRDGSDCRKCAEPLAEHHAGALGVERAPFFVVRDEKGEKVYTSVLQLVRERFGQSVTSLEQAGDVDPDDVGGI